MTRAREVAEAFAPWAGLVTGVVATGIVHQFGSDGVFNDCRAVSPGPLLIVGVLGIIACALSGFASWRSTSGLANEASRVIGIVSTGMSILFIFAIVLAMVAVLVLPPCFG